METELCKLAFKYGADKCPQINHQYTPFYYDFLKDKRNSIKKILEFGVGDNKVKAVIPNYTIGASLYMWRDFFPNAQIYGADIARECIFEDERIKTYRCNEFSKPQVEELIKTIGSDIDLVIDDADHHTNRQMDLLRYLMPLLQKSVTYIIEDCGNTNLVAKNFPEYNSYIPTLISDTRVKRRREGIIVLTYK